MKIETSEIKLSINDILAQGKESATKMISKSQEMIQSQREEVAKKRSSSTKKTGKIKTEEH
jgi:hypothetical protein